MNAVVVGIDGLDWYQPSPFEPENWLMPAPVAYVAPLCVGTGRAGAYRQAAQMQAPLPTVLPRMGLIAR